MMVRLAIVMPVTTHEWRIMMVKAVTTIMMITNMMVMSHE